MGLRLEHTCGWNDFNKKCSSQFLAEKYLEFWRLDPTTDIQTFQTVIQVALGVKIGYQKAWHARNKALTIINDEATKEYRRVWDYAETVKAYNRDSSVFVKLGNIESVIPVFERMYMCLDACKRGFMAGVRPILGVDGCHLKGPHPGQLLSAVGQDGNGNIYPVAWAVVEVENTDSWCWFLDLLCRDLEPVVGNLTFMSDRQKGLLEAFNRVVPNCDIRFCARHIWTNFKQAYPGEDIKQCFWRCARAYVKSDFKREMENMEKLSPGAHKYLLAISAKHWSRHAFSSKSKSETLLNNCSESFNNAIKKCRVKPVLPIMEWLRIYNMKRMFSKKEGIKKLKVIMMPNIEKKLNQAKEKAKKFLLVQSSPNEFEVNDEGTRYILDLEKKNCNCFRWELSGVPCAHAYWCIQKKRGKPETFVDVAFTKERYEKAYEYSIKSIPGPKDWVVTAYPQPEPPVYKRMPGRPNMKKRKKEKGEVEVEEKKNVKRKKHQKMCGNCGQLGHNKLGCKNQTVVRITSKKDQRKVVIASKIGQEEIILSQGPPQSSQASISGAV